MGFNDGCFGKSVMKMCCSKKSAMDAPSLFMLQKPELRARTDGPPGPFKVDGKDFTTTTTTLFALFRDR